MFNSGINHCFLYFSKVNIFIWAIGVDNEKLLMKKILYPTDFSETAENAFIFALQIADHLGASIITIHAFDKPDISNFNVPDTLMEVYDSIDLDVFENYEDEVPV